MSNFMYYLLFSIVAIFLDFVRIFLNASGFLHDLVTNLFADILFIAIILLAIWGLRRRHLSKAEQFFGFNRSHPLAIYVSGTPSANTSEGVFNSAEYVAANEIKIAIESASPNKLIDFLSGLIGGQGIPARLVKEIDKSSVEQDFEFPDDDVIILVGGPKSNAYTRYLQEDEKLLNVVFVEKNGEKYYKVKIGEDYFPIRIPGLMVIEKVIYNSQTIFIIQGHTEKATTRATRYLARRWRELDKEFKGKSKFHKLVSPHEI